MDTFIQDPPPGQRLFPGEDVTVTILAADCSGNKSWMKFDVITVDTIPPSFWYDSTQFIPLGSYQDSINSWLLYCVIDSSSIDTLGVAHKILLYYRDESYSHWQDSYTLMDSLSYPVFQRDDDSKRTIWFAENTYKLQSLRLYLGVIGEPVSELLISLHTLDANDNPVDTISSLIWPHTPLNDGQYHWYHIDVPDAPIIEGRKYCIQISATGCNSSNRVVWVTNGNHGDRTHYLRYTYDAGVTWGRNWNSAYLFQAWGKDLRTETNEQ
jgi:hypothetical protein